MIISIAELVHVLNRAPVPTRNGQVFELRLPAPPLDISTVNPKVIEMDASHASFTVESIRLTARCRVGSYDRLNPFEWTIDI